jgi:hypothetical protein
MNQIEEWEKFIQNHINNCQCEKSTTCCGLIDLYRSQFEQTMPKPDFEERFFNLAVQIDNKFRGRRVLRQKEGDEILSRLNMKA